MNIPLLLLAGLMVCAVGATAATPETLPVEGFEYGLNGWMTNDAGRGTAAKPYVRIDISKQAHTGKGALQLDLTDVKGFAAAGYDLNPICLDWAKIRADTLNLWVKGDGNPLSLTVGFQQYKDDLKPEAWFSVQVPISGTEWQQINIPFADLQASNTEAKLRTTSLFSLTMGVWKDTPSAHLLIDDISVSRSKDEPGEYRYAGLYDAAVTKLPPATNLTRLGNVIWPGHSPEHLEALQKMGLGFSSSFSEGPLWMMYYYTKGWLTNVGPDRPRAPLALAGLDLQPEDIDQDSKGNKSNFGYESAIYLPEVTKRMNHFLAQRVEPLADSPWVTSFNFAAPTSMYGELHFPTSTAGQYMVFSRPAKQNFRNWLKQQYGNNLKALSKAWGQPISSWDAIIPPDGQKANAKGVDTSQKFSDFIHWYNWCLMEVARNGFDTMRKYTKKPIEGMIGGPKVGYNQGIELGNIGPVMKMLGQIRPAWFDDTDSQTLYSVRYSQAATKQYGVDLMIEHVGPPGLALAHQYDMLLNGLACGAKVFHLAHLGELFEKDHFFAKAWRDLAPVAKEIVTPGIESQALMFHSYVTSWYRASRSYPDGLNLYDSVNTLWSADLGYPNWGRALCSPGVADDQMIEDGALKGRKLFVIPNAAVTMTTQKAVQAITSWVKAGGTLIGFGEGCLAYTVSPSRKVVSTPGLAGMVNLKSLAQAKQKGLTRVEQRMGKGRVVLYLNPADVELRLPNGQRFVQSVMPQLAAEAKKAGVRNWVWSDAGTTINPLYAGQDQATKRHIFTLDTIQKTRGSNVPLFLCDQSVTLQFDPSLKGEAEIISVTDSFQSVQGGEANFNPESRILRIRFQLPGKLTIKYGDSASGLKAAKNPLLMWEKSTLVLTPAGGYGVKQTQKPIEIHADGSLSPTDTQIPYLIHGNLHRPKFGRGPTFRVNFKQPGSISVHVNSVPSDALLVGILDGKEVLRQPLPNIDGKMDPFAKEYDRSFTVDVPAGEHTLQFDNLGDDWVSIDDYRIVGY
ncbi:MAG: beta-galactosidase [Armatimonadota bacterium]